MVSPPYDQFDPLLEEVFREESPHNIVHLILPKPGGLKTPSEVEGDSSKPYEAVRERLAGWLREEIIVPDQKPGIYVYRITYRDFNQERQNLGFFALGKLEEYLERGVAPHENILPAPREDRLKLRLATQADFGPVYMLYRDQKKIFEKIAAPFLKKRPLVEVKDMAGERHQLWKLTGPAQIKKVVEMLDSKTVLIADGHHRYDAALETHRRHPDNPWFAHRLMAFFNSEAEGFLVNPYHRLLVRPTVSLPELFDRLAHIFRIETSTCHVKNPPWEDFMNYLPPRNPMEKHRLFMMNVKGAYYFLKCPLEDDRMEVEFLDDILAQVLAVPQGELPRHLDYAKSYKEVNEAVDGGRAVAAFTLGNPEMEKIWSRAEAGQKLPPKSTFFYPKLLTGLVMNVNGKFYSKKG